MKKFILCIMAVVALAACLSSSNTEEVRPDDASGFVLLTDYVPDAILEIRYYSTYNFVGERSHPDYREGITDQQYANRMILRNAMVKAGFNPLYSEWWHFTLKDEPYPDTYFTFPVNEASVSANRIKK